MTFAVIVRTLGRAHLGDALDSLISQTRTDFEVAVVDMSGGSAAPVINTRRHNLPGLIHIDVGRRIGRSKALNLGIRQTSAPALGVLDDDNQYAPGHIDALVRGLAATGADLVYTPVRRQTLTPDGQLVHEIDVAHEPFSLPNLLEGNYIYATGIGFLRSIWRTVGGYDGRFPVYEDWDFLIRVGCAGRIAAISGDGGVSRNFTGDPTRSAHNEETADCTRSQVGLRWTHRRRLTGAFFDHRWRETGGWLVSWWWHGTIDRYLRRV